MKLTCIAVLLTFGTLVVRPAGAQEAPPPQAPQQPPVNGYPPSGYDQNGYPQNGYPQQPGYPPPQGYPSAQQPGYPPPQQPGYPPPQGYPQNGYAPQYYAQPAGYPQPQPMTLRYVEKPRYGLIAGGASMFGVMWGVTALVGVGIGENALAIPVAGPLVFIGEHNIDNAGVGFLVLDTIVQAGGLAMLIAGAVAKKKVPVYGNRFTLVPTANATGGGLAAFGHF